MHLIHFFFVIGEDFDKNLLDYQSSYTMMIIIIKPARDAIIAFRCDDIRSKLIIVNLHTIHYTEYYCHVHLIDQEDRWCRCIELLIIA